MTVPPMISPAPIARPGVGVGDSTTGPGEPALEVPANVTGDIAARFADGSWRAYADTAEAVGFCARPVRLVGRSWTHQLDPVSGEISEKPVSTFSSTETPLGVLYRACGNRRADVCPACSRVYARDTYAMVHAGVCGGKTIPESVSENPLLFTTLTAPSFGHVHGPRPDKVTGEPVGGRCRPRTRTTRCPHGRPMSCPVVHEPGDRVNGSPLCDDCYDWNSAIVWQWWAPELWRRTTIAIRRALAGRLDVPEYKLKTVASWQYAKVAETQARGLVHYHALIRLDGPNGPGSPAPLDGTTLAEIIEHAAQGVSYTVPGVDTHDPERVLAWGRELVIRVVRPGAVSTQHVDTRSEHLTPGQVAGYLAKYATKDTAAYDTNGPRPGHLGRLTRTCHELHARARAQVERLRADALAECSIRCRRGSHVQGCLTEPDAIESPYALLGKWAHMLGYRGHFSTKSRRYSVTLGKLRRARARYMRLLAAGENLARLDVRELEARLLADEDETTITLGSWSLNGIGWPTHGDQALALAAAARAREHQQEAAEERRKVRNELGEAA
ncbi:MAG: replication initiator [Nocardioides sp.]